MHLTPDILRAAYSFLVETPPFRRWKLPKPDTIKFRVVSLKDCYGQYEGAGKDHTIDISGARISHTDNLMKTLAHEIIHMRTHMLHKTVTHGAAFEKLKRRVCKQHGWDPREL
jgi:hypothetical protein